MLRWIFGVEERDLHHGDVQRVLLGIESYQKGRENAMVQTPAHALGFDPIGLEGVQDLGCEVRRASVGVLDFVVVGWEAVVVVDEVLGCGGVDFDGVAVGGLPVGGEDDDGCGFHFVSDFVADGLEGGVGGVRVGFEEVGASWGVVSDVFYVLLWTGIFLGKVLYRARGSILEFGPCWLEVEVGLLCVLTL